MSILIDGVFFLSDHGFNAINSTFHDTDGIRYFIVMLETGVEGLIGFGGKIGSDCRVILICV